ncbi:hypothetical protein [Flammeovirga pacifica]|uniref:hypothetical protein n=1 Tax=Flammeovirga pacifica TaxID=915059 RepID=UPI0013014C58|nr:hypothetical protein [Flammeovirga pacifica]
MAKKTTKSKSMEETLWDSANKLRGTNHKNATYRLNVKVQYGKVVLIDFGNGGSVHNG